MHHRTCGISSLLHSVNLILFTVLLVHLILRISPHHSHHIRSYHLSLPRPVTPGLKLISFTNPFLQSHSYRIVRSFLPTNCHPLSLGGSTPPPRLASWTQATWICSSCRNLRSSIWRDLSPARLSWRMQNVEVKAWGGWWCWVETGGRMKRCYWLARKWNRLRCWWRLRRGGEAELASPPRRQVMVVAKSSTRKAPPLVACCAQNGAFGGVA